jgi:predicted CoA-binding protein
LDPGPLILSTFDLSSMTEEAIRALLRNARTIAVVGASPKPERTANQIVRYLKRAGYTVYPVSLMYEEVEGLRCYPDVKSVPEHVDIVDIVVRAELVPPVMEDAIAAGASCAWMQLGIIHEEAAAKGHAAGLAVIMDRCIMVDHRFLLPRPASL